MNEQEINIILGDWLICISHMIEKYNRIAIQWGRNFEDDYDRVRMGE